MNVPRYVLTVSIGSVTRTQIWDSGKPLQLGHKLPWSLVRAESGVRLKHKSGSFCDIRSEVIDTETLVKVPDVAKGTDDEAENRVFLKLRHAGKVKPVFKGDALQEKNSTAKWTVFRCSGTWVLESFPFDKKHSEAIQGKSIFTISRKNTEFTIKIHDPMMKVDGIDTPSLNSGNESRSFTLSSYQLGNITLSMGPYTWRFTELESPMIPIIRGTQPIDAETIWFKKALRYSTGALALLLLLFSVVDLVEKKEEEEKPVEQFAKIVIKKKIPAPITPKAPSAAAIGKWDPTPQVTSGEKRKAPPKPIQTVQKPLPKTITPQVEKKIVSVEKTRPQEVRKTVQPTPPKKVVKRAKSKTNKAVLQAKNLKKSMKGLLGGLSRLAKTDVKKTKDSGRILANFSGSETATGFVPSVNLNKGQNVGVGFSDGSEKGKGAGGTSYRFAGKGGVKAGGKGTSFVSVGTGGGNPLMSEDGLSKEEVGKVINDHISEIRYCYETAIIRRPDIEGKVVVKFTINPSGRVKRASVKNSTVKDNGLSKCVVKRLATWKFPRPKGRISVGVQYPFVFRRL